jgi:hypothetical protein
LSKISYNIDVRKDIGGISIMKNITLHINPNAIKRRNEIHYAVIQSGIRSSATPSKREKQIKIERIQKQKGWSY